MSIGGYKISMLALTFWFAATALLAQTQAFDRPWRKVTVVAGMTPRDSGNKSEKIHLTCWYYPGLLVKELDEPYVKGATVTMVPLTEKEAPPCRRGFELRERSINSGEFFGGVKHLLLFTFAADSIDQGTIFSVVDGRSGRELFHHSVFHGVGGWKGYFRFSDDEDGGLSMTYRRVVDLDCSLADGKPGCWQAARRRFGLKQAGQPACSGYGPQQWEGGIDPPDLRDPSALDFWAIVTLLPRRSVRSVAGRVGCAAQE